MKRAPASYGAAEMDNNGQCPVCRNIYFHVTARRTDYCKARSDNVTFDASERRALPQSRIASSSLTSSSWSLRQAASSTSRDSQQVNPSNTIGQLSNNQSWTLRDSSASPSRNGSTAPTRAQQASTSPVVLYAANPPPQDRRHMQQSLTANPAS